MVKQIVFAVRDELTNRYLKLQYVDLSHKRSSVKLVKTGFPVFETRNEAQGYIKDGDELYYNYTECGINKLHLNIIELREQS